MTTKALKEKLHGLIEGADDEFLKLIDQYLEKHLREVKDYRFSPDEIKVFQERREEYLRGDGKLYSWEEAKEIIKAGGIKK